MKINPLWGLCLIIRLSLILIIWYLNNNITPNIYNIKYNIKNNRKIKIITLIFLLGIGFGFIIKGYTGSNNEIQLSKVFWHEARYVHGIIFVLASLYLLKDNLNMCLLLLLLDVIFSVLYRITFNK